MSTRIQIFFFVLLFSPALLSAQDAGKDNQVLRVKHTADFKLSGTGDAKAWEETQWISLLKRKGISEYLTQVKLLYSDSGIYSLFNCEDKKITSSLKEDFANLWTEDVVEIFFWPDESIPLYFEYELLNVKSSVLLFAKRRLFSDDSSASLVF